MLTNFYIKIEHAIGKAFLICGFMVLFSLLLSKIGPSIEREYFPIVSNFDYSIVSIKDGQVELTATVSKYRYCETKALTAFSIDESGVYTVSPIVFKEREPLIITRPIGPQNLGTWRIKTDAPTLKLEVTHKCHFLWNITTPLATIDIPHG